MTRTRQMSLQSRCVANFQLDRHTWGWMQKKERGIFSFNSNSEHKPISKIGRTHSNVLYVHHRFNYERNRSEQRSSSHPPPPPSLLSSIVPHSDRHKVSSFVFVAESCELNPFPLSLPVRPLTTRMTDDERRRLIRIDVDIWIADTRILRHGTRFKPSSTRPGHPLREIRTLDSLARRGVKTREETRRRHKRRNGIERFLHIARLDGLPRAKPSFERHSSLEEREGRKGEWFTSGNIGRDGKKPWKRIEKLDEFSTRFCSTTATSRCGL